MPLTPTYAAVYYGSLLHFHREAGHKTEKTASLPRF